MQYSSMLLNQSPSLYDAQGSVVGVGGWDLPRHCRTLSIVTCHLPSLTCKWTSSKRLGQPTAGQSYASCAQSYHRWSERLLILTTFHVIELFTCRTKAMRQIWWGVANTHFMNVSDNIKYSHYFYHPWHFIVRFIAFSKFCPANVRKINLGPKKIKFINHYK